MSEMKVIASYGPHTAIVDLGDPDAGNPLESRRGVMVDMKRGIVYPPRHIASILAHCNGYTEPFAGDAELMLETVRGHMQEDKTVHGA